MESKNEIQKICINHPNIKGLAYCKRCGGYLCRDCIIKIDDKYRCKKCYNDFIISKKSANSISNNYIFCDSCGIKLPTDSLYCSKCGKKVPKFKHSSGSNLSDNSKFSNSKTIPIKKNNGRQKKSELQEENNDDLPTKIIISSLSIIFISLFILYFASSKYYANSSEGFVNELEWLIAWLVGKLLLLIAGVIFVKYIFFSRKKGYGLLIFSILLLALSGYRSFDILYDRYTAKHTVTEFISSFDEIVNSGKIDQKKYNKVSYGKGTPFLQWFNDYAIKCQNLWQQMLTDIESENISNILTKNTLSSIEGISKGKTSLHNITKILDRYENLMFTEMTNVEKKIQKLDADETIKKGVLDSFNKRKNISRNKMKNYFELERDVISSLNNLLNFCKAKYGKYWFEGESICFRTQFDVDTYNKKLLIINELATQEAALINDMRNSSLQSLTKMKDLTK